MVAKHDLKTLVQTSGYGIELMDEKQWPVAPSQVRSSDEFDANIKALSEYVCALLALFQDKQRHTLEIKIGKTSVAQNARYASFDKWRVETWRYGGGAKSMSPAKRFQQYQSVKQYHCLIVVACFVRADLSPALAANRISQEQLALSYEDALDKQMAVTLKSQPALASMAPGDPGGGGRKAVTTYVGSLVYVAIKKNALPPSVSLPRLEAKARPDEKQDTKEEKEKGIVRLRPATRSTEQPKTSSK